MKVIGLSILGYVLAAQNPLNYQELLSFKPPLTDDKFNHWKPKETSMLLKNKIVLVPELVNKIGFVKSKFVSFIIHISGGVRVHRLGTISGSRNR